MEQTRVAISPEEEHAIRRGFEREHARARAISHSRPTRQPNELPQDASFGSDDELDEREVRLKKDGLSKSSTLQGMAMLGIGVVLVGAAVYLTLGKGNSSGSHELSRV